MTRVIACGSEVAEDRVSASLRLLPAIPSLHKSGRDQKAESDETRSSAIAPTTANTSHRRSHE